MEVKVTTWMFLILVGTRITYMRASASPANADDEETVGITALEITENVTIRSLDKEDDDPEEDQVRLADVIVSGVTRGRVEIYHDGRWGTVCDDGFDDSAASVVCRQLQYETGWVSNGHNVPHGTGTIWLDEVQCSGEESHLLDCRRSKWGRHDCTHREDVSIECTFFKNYSGLYHEGEIRLVDTQIKSDEIHGRLEIFHNGEWGTICDRNPTCLFNVACRQLGFASGRQMYSPVGKERRIWIADLHCCGRNSVAECDHSGWGNHHCTHFQDLGVACFGPLQGSQKDENSADCVLASWIPVVLGLLIRIWTSL